jgi:hypothetical protein
MINVDFTSVHTVPYEVLPCVNVLISVMVYWILA